LDVSNYDLFIDIDFQALKFKGTLGVKLKTADEVILNSVGLEVERAHSDGTDFRFNQKDGNLRIETGPFDGVLKVEYAGRIPDALAGIYRAPYDKTHIVTTHFEAAQARRMFPCVDRPDAKAEFKLSVRIDSELEAISNMPIRSQKSDGDKKIVTFQTTPRMSTYLLYLGVGKFQVRTSKVGETEVIVAATPGKVQKGAFAEDEAGKALAYFNSYYKIPYALPKVHLIAVPEFPMGAMENWGAITFREILLLVDENTSSRTKMRAAMAIAHELAHQWFGDLVTMKWWDDIWLNESFATYMAYKAIDHIHPEWRIWDDFCNGEPRVETQAGAMERDFLKNTHPIQVNVDSPDEIEQIFDEISYGKGAHVLQMIDAYVGEEAFREGVGRYLSAHSYSNATGDDLWSAIEQASGKPVKRIMSAWVRQAGFPVVTAHPDDRRLKLMQERMLISGKSEKVTWPVPLTVEVNGQRKSILMENPAIEIEVNGLKSLRINPNRTGFYATNNKSVDDIIWRSEPSEYDRWGIIFDAFLFLVSGVMKFDEYLSALKRFEHEDEALPAREVSDQLQLLYTLVPSKTLEVSKRLHHTLLETFESKSDEKSSILRGTLASRLALIDPEYAATLAPGFKEYGRVPPDMRSAVAIAYAKSTNDIEYIMSEYRKSRADEDKNRLLSSMTVFSDEKLVERTLNFVFGGEVKRQDILRAVFAAAQNPHVRNMVWDWLKSKIGKLQEVYQGTGVLSLTLAEIIPILCVGRGTEAESFFAEHMIADAETGIRVGLEKLHAYDQLAKEIMRHT
jgi:tricorn protease interacting factor F2/3